MTASSVKARPHRRPRLRVGAAAALLVCTLCAGWPAVAAPGRDAVARHLDSLLAAADGAAIGWPAWLDRASVRRAYAAADHRPIWLRDAGRPGRALVARLREADRQGLRPAAYDARALARALHGAETAGARVRARLELRLTAAFLSYARDLRHGRPALRPARYGAATPEVQALLAGVRAAPATDVHLARLAPRHAGYRDLQRALRRHLAIRDAGGWPVVPGGPTLQSGDSGARVARLHRRLAIGGDLRGYDAQPARFDDALAAAVQRFQARHGLVPDGVVAARTLAALNVSAAKRAAQLAGALERLRWDRPPAGLSVRVNVPGFRMSLLDDGRARMTARAIVGMAKRPTPVFADRITHLVFNPSWTVPQSIARADLLPRIRRDPGYLRRADMNVYAGWSPDSAALHPSAVSWDRAVGRLDSYRLVQAPGPGNPLGRVKFMFPNRHNVYIHDTPDTDLFDHARRTYSSGCIRIDRPMDLARALLAGTDGWNVGRIQRAVASGRTIRARLDSPVPVRIVYRTAWVDDDGTLHLRPDIYGRDEALARRLRALDGES